MDKVRFLVIQTAFIGDSILTLPMIQKLKELNPGASIDVLCHPLSKEVFDCSPYVENVIVYDKRGTNKGALNVLKFAGSIKKNNYKRIYSPHRSARTSILVKLSGVEETFGFSNSALHYIYRNVISYREDLHEVQRNLSLIGSSDDQDNWRILPEITIKKEAEEKINCFLSGLPGKKYAAVAPGSVWETKKYPRDGYAKIIRYLLDKGFYIFLIGGLTDKLYCDEITGMFEQNVTNTAGKFSITESIGLLKKCSLLISNDSAPTHFAMCADIPVLTIYCSTVAAFGFYPYNKSGKYISYDELECKPCGIHGHQHCPIKTFDCANKLDENKIFSLISGLISE